MTISSEQRACHEAVVHDAIALFNRAGHPAIAEVCELLDCGLVTDVEGDASGPLVVGIGQSGERGAGLYGFWATPHFKTIAELEAFCLEHIEKYSALDLERDGYPEKWFWEVYPIAGA